MTTLSRPLRPAFMAARCVRLASPSTPSTVPALRASGNEKLPIPQNRSSTRSSGPASSCSVGKMHHAPVDVTVDLHEVDGLEVHANIEFGQGVVQRTHRPHRDRTAQPYPVHRSADRYADHASRQTGAAAPLSASVGGSRTRNTKCDGVLGDSHFDLRQARPY